MSVNNFLASFAKRPSKPEKKADLTPEARDTIQKHFPGAKIVPSGANVYIRIQCKEGQVLLTLKADELYLSQLYKCSGRSGTEMLRTIVQLATDLRLQRVTLVDASSIYVPSTTYHQQECHLPLAPLSIFIYGESWYQRQGFTAPSDEEDRKHNERIRQVPFQRTIMDVTDEWKEAFPDSPSLSIPAAEMWKWVNDTYLRPDALPCDWRVAFLRKLLEHAPLQYTIQRSYSIRQSGGKRTKRTKTQKNTRRQ
jgi:hypothetical protein